MTIKVLDQTLTIQDQDMYVKTWLVEDAKATPIILFHESLGSVNLWRGFPKQLALATQRTVIAYDRLGFGKSSPREDILSFNFVAEEAVDILPELLKQLEIHHFIAMGHSIGGSMAITCAARHPLLCKAVITESAQSMLEDVSIAGIRKAKASFNDGKFLKRLAIYHGPKTQWVLDAWTETWLSPEFLSWRLDDDIAAVQCPLLVIHGENDEYGSLAQAQRLFDLAQCAKHLEMIKDGSHFPHHDKEQEVLHAITLFLNEVD